jgi:hypothetical protein
MEAAASPFPKDDKTPPVTKMNFVFFTVDPLCNPVMVKRLAFRSCPL